MQREIWFWQRMVTPHMAYVAVALAQKGISVSYVAEEPMSDDRAAQGWKAPELPGVTIHYAKSVAGVDALLTSAPKGVIHLCQGIRGNGMVQLAQRKLAQMGQRFWVVMETIDDTGVKGLLKRLYYRILFRHAQKHISGFLAIGEKTSNWLVGRGVSIKLIYPFTYFLQESPALKNNWANDTIQIFRFIFVGQLIERKCVDLLLSSLSKISNCIPFSLKVIGTGPIEIELQALGKKLLGDKVEWLGKQTMEATREQMEMADCLVLPSRHDGWGAVVSEALMAGTPAICSDSCGAAEAVLASGVGGVFASGDENALTAMLMDILRNGPQTPGARSQLSQWGQALGAMKGADYLLEVLAHHGTGGSRPVPPWRKSQ